MRIAHESHSATQWVRGMKQLKDLIAVLSESSQEDLVRYNLETYNSITQEVLNLNASGNF